KEIAHFAHTAREPGVGLIERELRIRRIELHERLSGAHELGVVRADRNDGTGDLRCDLDDIAIDVRIVRGHAPARIAQPVDRPREATHEEHAGRDREPSPPWIAPEGELAVAYGFRV